MPADLLTQLERAGELLDRLAPPLTIDEVVTPGERAPLGRTRHAQPAIPVEVSGNSSSHPSRSPRTWLRIAATIVLVAGGLTALLLRETPDSDEAQEVATPTSASTTRETSEELPVDPRSVEDWPPDAFPSGAVLRLSGTLGRFGHVWVYDIPSDGSVCVVRKTADGYAGCSVFDAETYRTGQAWTLEGDPLSSSGAVLWGLAPLDVPITVTAGSATASSDPSGIWYLALPAGVSDVTIVTPTASYSPRVTLQPLPTTTIATSVPSDPTPSFTPVALVSPPAGYALESVRVERSGGADVGMVRYSSTDGTGLLLILRTDPDFFTPVLSLGRATWRLGDRTVVDDSQAGGCTADGGCSFGVQWDDLTAISVSWEPNSAGQLAAHQTSESLREVVASLVEVPPAMFVPRSS